MFHANFDVLGIPKAQPRHRAFGVAIMKDGKPVLNEKGKPLVTARVHNKGTAEWWKSQIILAGKTWRPRNPLAGPIHIRLIFWMPRPKRLMRNKDTEGAIPHTSKPDKENLEKPIFDALTNDGWFQDDAQIFLGNTGKFYHAKGGAPGAEIYIDELESSDAMVAAAIEMVRARL